MQLSTRGRYAVMALLDLCIIQEERGPETPVTLAEIAERQDISLSYLEQLFAKLRMADIVKSVRGPGGGYVLAGTPADITLDRVIASVNETTDMTRCGVCNVKMPDAQGCVGNKRCNSHNLWVALGEHMQNFLADTTLASALAHDAALVNGHLESTSQQQAAAS